MLQGNRSPEHFPSIDLLRGIAVLWVFFHHIRQLGPYPQGDSFWAFVKFIGDAGFIGVDLFFVISGFLITGLLLPVIESGRGIHRFYLGRAFKILPPYFLVLGVGSLVAIMIPVELLNGYPRPTFWNLIACSLFLHNYIAELHVVVGHFWSLAIEEHFYLAYPLLILAVSRVLKAVRRRLVITVVLSSGIIVSNLLRWFNFDLSEPTLVFQAVEPMQSSLLRMDGLMLGCLLRLWWPEISKVFESKWKFVLLTIALGALVFLVIRQDVQNQHFWFYFLASFSFFLLVGSMVGVHVESRWFRPMIFVGKRSYAIYLWHYPMLYLVCLLPLGPWGRIFIAAGFTMLLGVMTNRYLELPFRRIRDRFLR